MCVKPPDSSPVESPLADELHDFGVGYHRRLVHQSVVSQQQLPASGVSDEKLTEDELVPADFATRQQSI